MGRGRAALALLVLVATGAALPVSPAHAAGPTVEVRDNYFTPSDLRAEPGDAVSWRFVDDGHSVRADDGSFELPASGTGVPGAVESHTFATPGIYRYFCEVHGAPGGLGMSGVVYVGVDPSTAIRSVPAEYPTVAAAVRGAPAGTTVEIAPGVYPESVVVMGRDITLRGTGTTPAAVAISGEGRREVGVAADRADGIRVENLTVADFRGAGILVRDVDRFTLSRVALTNNATVGLAATRSRAGSIADIEVRGSATGLLLSDCADCGAAITSARVSAAVTGLLVRSFGHADVRGSELSGSDVAVKLMTDPASASGRQRGASIAGNVLEGGRAALAVSGGWDDLIEGNELRGGGISITGVPVPSGAVRVRDNVTPWLRWDAVGVDVCFSGNRTSAGGEAPSDPPALERTFACS